MRKVDPDLKKFPSRPTQAYHDPNFWYRVTGVIPTPKKTFPPKEELIQILKEKGINSHGYKSLRKQDPELFPFPSYPVGAYHDPHFWYTVTGKTPPGKPSPPVEEAVAVFKAKGVTSKLYPQMRKVDPDLKKFPSRPTQAYHDPNFWYKVTGVIPASKKTFPPVEEAVAVFKTKRVSSNRYAGMRKEDPELRIFPIHPVKIYQDPDFWYKVTGNIPTSKKTFPPKEELIQILKEKGLNSHSYRDFRELDPVLFPFPVHPAAVYKDPHFWRKVTGKKLAKTPH